ncbi:DUF7344 domain-containing protein [Haladaptatus salinisoli]|uniref:DUF7344 domain-containing protein n=1 Tax=Haladaptatus salinisoli TaxID=2884876 RepID=UPI001D0B8DCE|nr:hypothetical protein [Haladaptatus salinisoli]
MGETPDDGERTLAELLEFLEAVDSDTITSTSSAVYKLLEDEQRRHLVLYLAERETATPLSRVALEIASRCNDTSFTHVTPAEQEEIRIRLVQKHLPRLADYGVLSWSYGDEIVKPIPRAPFSEE